MRLIRVAAIVGTVMLAWGQVSANVDEGLIAHYSFERGVADEVTSFESPDSSTADIIEGRIGNALQLDGKTSFRIPVDLNPDLMPAVTVSVWVRVDERVSDPELETHLPNRSYVVSEAIVVENLKNDRPYFYGESLRRAVVGPKHDVARGQWQHVALVRTIEDRPLSGGTIAPHVVSQFYSGGRMTELAIPFRSQEMETSLILGSNSTRSEHKFRGAVDDLRIYDRALNEDEINKLALGPLIGTLIQERDPAEGGVSAGSGGPSGPSESPTNPPPSAPPAAPEGGDPVGGGNSPHAGILDPNPNPIPESEMDDLTEGVLTPERDSPTLDWEIQSASWEILSDNEEDVSPGTMLAVSASLRKNDSQNDMPSIRIQFDLGGGREKKIFSLTKESSELSPVVFHDFVVHAMVPKDLAFKDGEQSVTWRPEIRLLNSDGYDFADAQPDNHRQRLSIDVERPIQPTGGTEVYIDQSVLVFAEPARRDSQHDTTNEVFLDNGELLQGIFLYHRGGKICKVRVIGHSGAREDQEFCGGSAASGVVSLFRDISLQADEAMVGISVCRSTSNTNLQGLRIHYRSIGSDGALGAATGYTERGGGCFDSSWTAPAFCPTGAAANGISLAISNGTSMSPQPYLHSMSLACGEVKVREVQE